MNHRKREL